MRWPYLWTNWQQRPCLCPAKHELCRLKNLLRASTRDWFEIFGLPRQKDVVTKWEAVKWNQYLVLTPWKAFASCLTTNDIFITKRFPYAILYCIEDHFWYWPSCTAAGSHRIGNIDLPKNRGAKKPVERKKMMSLGSPLIVSFIELSSFIIIIKVWPQIRDPKYVWAEVFG
jgi:hypothetical protein